MFSSGDEGLFTLNCKSPRSCTAADAIYPAWPALAPSVHPADEAPGATAMEAVISELIAFVKAADTQIAASRNAENGQRYASFDHLRRGNVVVLQDLPRDQVLRILNRAARAEDMTARLAQSAIQLQVGDCAALSDISRVMMDDDPAFRDVRGWVANSLRMGRSNIDCVPQLSEWIQSADLRVRLAVTTGLSAVGDRKAAEPLLRYGIADKEQEVRYRSLIGLHRILGHGPQASPKEFAANEAACLGFWLHHRDQLLVDIQKPAETGFRVPMTPVRNPGSGTP